jgi:RNA polymerase sigma-70 factor (ECF subfamily)
MNPLLKVIQLYKNEAQLIKKAAKDHRDAQHALYEMHAPKMLSVCRYYIKDVQQSEEVMLNGFFKVFTQLKTFKSEGSFEGWIRRIMVRESISFLRKKKRLEFSADDMEIYEEPDNDVHTEMDVDDIQQLIDKLPDGYRMVFNMYAIEGYKHNEIAAMLDIAESTSKTQLFKARKMLQQQIKQLNKTSNGTN